MRRFIFILALFPALLAVLLQSGCTPKVQLPEQSNVQHPEWLKDAVIYEVNVRQFSPEGTFAALEQHLDRLKELGVDVLWIMPMHPIGTEGRKGTLGSYYSVKDYKDVNPEFGTLDDFKHFLDAAHGMGFKVILDWVANHTARDSKWAVEHPEWFYRDSLGNFVIEYDWTDIARLDYDCAAKADLYAAMKDALSFWVDLGVDGFRCDVADHVPVEFWEEACTQLRAENPELFFLAEAESGELQKNAFDSFYPWKQMHLWYALAKGEVTADSLANFYISYQKEACMPAGTMPMNFTSNHDQNSWTGTDREQYGDAVKQFAALSFLVPGIPLIYTGQEVGSDKRLAFFEKDPVDWSSDSDDMSSFYSSLIAMRRQHACLWAPRYGGFMNLLPSDHPEEIFAFERESEGDIALAMFNFSDVEVTFTVDNDVVADDTEFTLPPHGYHIIFGVGDCLGDCDNAEYQE